MGSCQLFHGPGARQAALARVKEIGRLVAPPFGDEGLSVDESREICTLLLSVPVGEKVGVVVVGPIDNAKTLKSMDALLKSIEEVPSPYMQPILWADDLGGVISTVRSRCLETWAPGSSTPNPEFAALAKQIVSDVLASRFYTVPGAVIGSKNIKDEVELPGETQEADETEEDDEAEVEETVKKSNKKKFRGVELLWAITDELASDLEDPARRALWDRLRKVTRWRNPTPTEIVAALVG